MNGRVVGIILILAFTSTGLARGNAEFPQDREHLLRAFKLFSEANDLTQPPAGQSSFSQPPEISKHVENLIEEGLSEGRAISNQYLDGLQPEMRTYFREYFLRGQTLYLSGFRSGNIADQGRGIQLIRQFHKEFWQSNSDQIWKKVSLTTAFSMSFWGFVGRLLIGVISLPILFSFTLIPLVAILAVVGRHADETAQRLPLLAYPVLGTTFVVQSYFWGLWAAYCASLAELRAAADGVEHVWVPYVMAFLFVLGPIKWMASKELFSSESAEDERWILSGATIYSAIAVGGFIAFSVWPALARVPFSWFLALVVPWAAA